MIYDRLFIKEIETNRLELTSYKNCLIESHQIISTLHTTKSKTRFVFLTVSHKNHNQTGTNVGPISMDSKPLMSPKKSIIIYTSI